MQTSSKFAGGSGAEVRLNFEKKFELGCKSAPLQNKTAFLKWCGFTTTLETKFPKFYQY